MQCAAWTQDDFVALPCKLEWLSTSFKALIVTNYSDHVHCVTNLWL